MAEFQGFADAEEWGGQGHAGKFATVEEVDVAGRSLTGADGIDEDGFVVAGDFVEEGEAGAGGFADVKEGGMAANAGSRPWRSSRTTRRPMASSEQISLPRPRRTNWDSEEGSPRAAAREARRGS